jgi:hypothetical protein
MRVLCLTVALLEFAERHGPKKNSLPHRRKTATMSGIGPQRRATSGWLSVAFGAKRKWRHHHSHAPLPAALDHRGA